MLLSGELLLKWKAIMSEISDLDRVCIPRCYFSSKSCTGSIHGFCDALAHAFAAVIYLRCVQGDRVIEVFLDLYVTPEETHYPLLGIDGCSHFKSPH